MSNLNLLVPQPVKAFIDAEVAAGRYRNPSDFICALVREAKKKKARERVEVLLQEAIDSGEPVEATPSFWKKLQGRANRATQRTKQP
jgi:antitoxin ParD1/3/4